MTDIVSQRNIGAMIAAVASVRSQAASAAVNGGSIDRQAHNLPLSCLLHQDVGAETGSPTAISVVTKLQHSPDNSTWSDYTDPNTGAVAATAAATAVNTDEAVSVCLTSASRYIRAVTTPTLTGGTSPTVLVAANVILGGQDELPAI